MDTTTTAYREPTDQITTWGPLTGETACVAQLLYMYDRLELPFDPDALDHRVGRTDGQMDLHGGGCRVLLEEGFHIRHISGDDLRRLATDTGYLRELLLSEGETEEHLDEMLPTWGPQVQARNAAWLALYEEYADQVDLVQRPSTMDDAVQLLTAGWHAVVKLINPDGTTTAVLLIRLTGPDTALAYLPSSGLFQADLDGLSPLAHGVSGYRMP